MSVEVNEDTHFSSFVANLQNIGNASDAIAYADRYISAHTGAFPLIEGTTAHFVYKATPGMTVGVMGDWNGFNPLQAIMEPIGGGLLHYQHIFEPDARLDYLFMSTATAQTFLNDFSVYNNGPKQVLRDPLNMRIARSGLGDSSELAMPTYRRPTVTVKQPNVPNGTLRQGTIKSDMLKQERAYTIYLPHGYTSDGNPYPSIYFHDGGDYLTMGEAPTVLDNLIHEGELPPTVAIFVSPIERTQEYNCNDTFTSFFCDELVPEMQRLYHLNPDPKQCGAIGPSMGGIISLYIGSQRPDVFGLIGAQSSAVKSVYGLEKYDARAAYAVKPHRSLRLYLVIGSYEKCFSTDNQGQCQDLLTPIHELRTVLERSDYEYHYREDHQGHSWGLWRDTLADALTYLFGKRGSL
ncbi:MAG: hypothetical protein NVS4B11_15800 [Ktedonobacteraceae bacterium]